MSQLLARVQAELATARKAQDKSSVLLLGTLLAEIRNREIELRRLVNDDDAIDVVRKAIKKRRESIEMYTSGGRLELAEQEASELRALERYLPARVDPEEIRVAVRAAMQAGATNLGAIMGRVMPAFKGRAEGGEISEIVRQELAARA